MAENIQSEDMSALDEAEGYYHLLSNVKKEGVGINELARSLGVTVGPSPPPNEASRPLRRGEAHVDGEEDYPLPRRPPGPNPEADAQKDALHICVTSTIFDDIEEPAPDPLTQGVDWEERKPCTSTPEAIEDYFPQMVEEIEVLDDVPSMLKLSASPSPNSDHRSKEPRHVGLEVVGSGRCRGLHRADGP